jgi:DNA integrity scanning protein DisA with diadenylate cyclase activity
LKRDPCFYICEIIGELKREIDLKKEELKLKIDEEAEALITQMSKYEEECKKNLKQAEFLVKANILDVNTKKVNVKLQKWSNDLKILESNENKWKG